ncbi:MAG: hypothetical protein AB7S44_04085 [Spirochaetales bacterium]
MANDMSIQAMELSFTILEDIIMLKPLTNKKDLMAIANKASADANASNKYPEVVKMAYREMVKKLETLTFDDIKEIREIIED